MTTFSRGDRVQLNPRKFAGCRINNSNQRRLDNETIGTVTRAVNQGERNAYVHIAWDDGTESTTYNDYLIEPKENDMAYDQYNPKPFKVGDRVKLNPNEYFSSSDNQRRQQGNQTADVIGIDGNYVKARFTDSTVVTFHKGVFVKAEPETIAERKLEEVRRERKKIETEMISATGQIKVHQKTIEDSVPKLEEYDKIIAALEAIK